MFHLKTRQWHKVLLILLLLPDLVKCQDIMSCNMKKSSQYNNVVTDSWMIKEISLETARSSMSCAFQCLQHSACVTFMVDLDTKRCRLHAASVTSSDPVTSSPGFKYYESCRAAGSVGSRCSSISDCRLAHMECVPSGPNQPKVCKCSAKHHYDPNIQACVSQCQKWGKEFAAFPGYELLSNNALYKDGHPYDQLSRCQQLCIDGDLDFECLSLEFSTNPIFHDCILSDVTAAKPGAKYVFTDSNSTYYQRQCLYMDD